MANPRGSSMYFGKHPHLPPKIPSPSVSQSYPDYVPNPIIASNGALRPREGHNNLRRTSSETLVNVIEEQPSWLDDLLNEPETPVRRGGHRRSSSDSFASLDTFNTFNISFTDLDEYKYKSSTSIPSWAPQDIDHGKGAYQIPMYAEMNSAKHKNRTQESSVNGVTHPGGPSGRDNVTLQSSGSSCALREEDGVASMVNEKYEAVEPGDAKSSSGRKDGSNAKPSASETDTKRAKQQFAQRSRVRKLQYIAELERNVQALQVEGNEVSAELDFLNQQNLILSMENNSLKQRLENLAQEQLIKYMEHEVLEREVGRLRTIYQQQQQLQVQHLLPQQSSSGLRRTKSRDLESQFASLSMKHKESSSERDPVTGPLRS